VWKKFPQLNVLHALRWWDYPQTCHQELFYLVLVAKPILYRLNLARPATFAKSYVLLENMCMAAVDATGTSATTAML